MRLAIDLANHVDYCHCAARIMQFGRLSVGSFERISDVSSFKTDVRTAAKAE